VPLRELFYLSLFATACCYKCSSTSFYSLLHFPMINPLERYSLICASNFDAQKYLFEGKYCLRCAPKQKQSTVRMAMGIRFRQRQHPHFSQLSPRPQREWTLLQILHGEWLRQHLLITGTRELTDTLFLLPFGVDWGVTCKPETPSWRRKMKATAGLS